MTEKKNNGYVSSYIYYFLRGTILGVLRLLLDLSHPEYLFVIQNFTLIFRDYHSLDLIWMEICIFKKLASDSDAYGKLSILWETALINEMSPLIF